MKLVKKEVRKKGRDSQMNKSFDKSAMRNVDPQMELMKVITKQPGKMPVPYNQKNVLDGSYLR